MRYYKDSCDSIHMVQQWQKHNKMGVFQIYNESTSFVVKSIVFVATYKSSHKNDGMRM